MSKSQGNHSNSNNTSLSLLSLNYHSDHNDSDQEYDNDHNNYNIKDKEQDNHKYRNNTTHTKPVWTVCIDENTGCPYYWEQNSNKVSWEPPPEYSATLDVIPPALSIPPKNVHHLPRKSITNHNHSQTPLFPAIQPVDKHLSSEEEDEDEPEEKIELITSYYNDDSASDDETKPKSVNSNKNPPPKRETRLESKKKSVERELVLFGPQLPEDVEKAIFSSDKNTRKDNPSYQISDVIGYKKLSNSNKSVDLDEIISKIEQEKPIDLPVNDNVIENNGIGQTDCSSTPPQSDETVSDLDKKRKLVFSNYSSKCFKRDNQDLQESKTYDITYTTKYSESFEISGERVGLGFAKSFDEKESEKRSGAIVFEKGEPIIPKDEVSELKAEITDEQCLLDTKLKCLTSNISPVSIFHKLNIEMKVLWTAYEEGELSAEYMKRQLIQIGNCLTDQEEQAVSPPWIYRYHSDSGCYMYENTETGEQQKEHPSEQDMDICCTPPPLPSTSPFTPPPPPSMSPFNRLQDDDYNEADLTTVKPQKDNFVAELDSFYSDLATLETTDVKTETTSVEKPPSDDNLETNTPQGKEQKKKSKSKTLTTTGLKNKSVSSLVAKWKKVQESL